METKENGRCPRCGGEMRPCVIWNMGTGDSGVPDFEDADKCRDCDLIVPVQTGK